MLPQCLNSGCDTWSDLYGVSEVVNHFKTIHGAETVQLESKTATLKMKFDHGEISGEGTKVVKVPLIIEYDGIHLLFVITHWNGRHYFWFYFVEDGILSDGRQFHAELNLISTRPLVPMKKSDGQILVHPITTSIDEIFKDTGKLHFVSDKGMKKNFVDGNNYMFEVTLKELPRKVIILPSPLDAEIDTIADDIKEIEKNLIHVDEIEKKQVQLEIQEGEIHEEVHEGIFLIEEVEDDEILEEVDDDEILEEVDDDEILEEVDDNEIKIEEVDDDEIKIENVPEIENQSEKVEVRQQDLGIVEKYHEEVGKLVELQKIVQKIDTSDESEGNSRIELWSNKIISVACPNCHNEVFKMSTRGELTITPEFSKLEEDVYEPIFSNWNETASIENGMSEESMDNDLDTKITAIVCVQTTTTNILKPDQDKIETVAAIEEEMLVEQSLEKEATKMAVVDESEFTTKLMKKDYVSTESKTTEKSVGVNKERKWDITFDKYLRQKSFSDDSDEDEGFSLTEEDQKTLEFFQTTRSEYIGKNPHVMFPSYRKAADCDKKMWKKVIFKAIGRPNWKK